MKDSCSVRYAKRGDLNEIAEFLHQSWQTEYRQLVADDYLDNMSVEERYAGLLCRYDKKESEFLMLLDNNRLIGVAVFGKSFTEGYSADGEISAIYLKSDYIGKGYGHRLFSEAEQALSSKGYTHFILDVLSDNVRAVKFYLAHCFVIVDNRQVRLGDKDYPLTVMRKAKN